MSKRAALRDLDVVSVVNTVITHRVHHAEERGRIVEPFSPVMDAPGCRGHPFPCELQADDNDKWDVRSSRFRNQR